MLITNDSHKPKGEFIPSEPEFGRLSTVKELRFEDDNGQEHSVKLPQIKQESFKCPIDQDLCADDFSLSTMIKLGNKLETMKAPVIDRFAQVDITLANLHLLQTAPYQMENDPDAPIVPAAPIESVAPIESTDPSEL